MTLAPKPEPYRIRCAEVWGGVTVFDMDVRTQGLTASVLSQASGFDKGGDIYYCSVCSADSLTRIAIADMRGHGESASRLSQWFYDALQQRMNALDGGGILRDLNEIVLSKGFEAITTAAVVSYYLPTRRLYFSYAGHPPLFLQRAGGTWHPLALESTPDIANLPLGVLPDVRYDQAEVNVSSGDRLFLYTDGVLECPAAEGNGFYGDRHLNEALSRAAVFETAEVKRHVFQDLLAYSGGNLTHDDVTLIAAELH